MVFQFERTPHNQPRVIEGISVTKTGRIGLTKFFILTQRSQIQNQLADTTSTLATGRQFFEHAFELLADPQGFYRSGNAGVKKALLKVIFRKLYLDAHQVGGHDLVPGIKELIETGSLTAEAYSQETNHPEEHQWGSLPQEEAPLDKIIRADLLAMVLSDHGSNRAAVVEVPGIEPGSSVASSGLLRAQSASPLLGSTGHADEPV